jgi:hypothetical protein
MDVEQHARLIEGWREAREHRLRSPTGWLSLIDRIPLVEGENQFPFGTLVFRDGVARLGDRVLPFDEKDPASIIAHGGRRYELLRRGDFHAVRVKDPAAPALLNFRGLDHFPIDPAWRIVGRFQRFEPPRETNHQLDVGPGDRRVVPGLAHFTAGGKALTLEPVIDETSNRLYFVFSDLTSKTETYPAGRFLYAEIPTADEVVLDFNMAFNPPCAFTEFAVCPLPPPANRLPVAIPAGEKRYAAAV